MVSKAGAFIENENFVPILIFAGKVKSPLLVLSPIRCSTHVSPHLAQKYWTRVEMAGSGKYTNLQQCIINCFMVQAQNSPRSSNGYKEGPTTVAPLW